MPELEERPVTGTTTRRDQEKSTLRLLAHGDHRWDEDEYSPEEEQRMIELYAGTLASIDEGEIVKSKVLEIRDNMVILDIGFKSEGAVPLATRFWPLPALTRAEGFVLVSAESEGFPPGATVTVTDWR